MSNELWTPDGSITVDGLESASLRALSMGRHATPEDDPTLAEMRLNRRANSRTGTPNMQFATNRTRDPFFYWRENNLPYDVTDENQLGRIRDFCRLLYLTHPILSSAIDIYCLAAETKVITRGGVKSIVALEGNVEMVLTKGGKWVDAKFDCFGKDHLRKVTVSRYGVTKEIFATPTHRWFVEKKHYRKNQVLSREETTDSLVPGDELVSATPWRNEFKKTNPSPFGVAHGFVVGDGSRESNGGCIADLHGAKDMVVLPYMNGCSTHVYEMSDGPTTRVYGLPGYFKDLPSLGESAAYLAGWLSGYFLADGTVNAKGQCFLDSSSLANLEHVRDVCTRLGIVTYPIYDIGERDVTAPDSVTRSLHMCRINIDPFDLTPGFFLGDEHRRRWEEAIGGRERSLRRSNWMVVSVEETDRFESVYCATVPDTESFVLEDFILTGNSKYPLTGMEIECKDPKLKEFYEELFFDDLDYEEYLIDVGREYWTVGEAFPFGTFNDLMGVWEDDELVDPADVKVVNSPFLRDPRFEMRIPKVIRDIVASQEPKYEYEQLLDSYPELVELALHPDGDDAFLPVSSTLVRHLMFKGHTFLPRGVPILMRAFRAVIQEGMLQAAQDAVADRLYTPLILAKLGASATDLGTNQPWIPTQGDIDSFQEALDVALAADFRVMTHHFGVNISNVFGREQMPRMDGDFDRLDERMLQTFGMSKTLLSGASGGQTYAADALNRDLLTQLLSSYQRKLKRLFRDRAAVVAEAQEHYDYETVGSSRRPIMEEVLEVDEETGERRIIERPKLLVPDLSIKAMNMQDDASLRQLMEALRAQGVPISMETRLINLPIDLADETEKVRREQVDLAIEAQETRKATYEALKARGLPVPADLLADFTPKARASSGAGAAETAATPPPDPDAPGPVPPLLGDDLFDTDALTPPIGVDVDGDGSVSGDEDGLGEDDDAVVKKLPRNKARPPESDEQRDSMPKASGLSGPRHVGTRRLRESDEVE